MQLKKGLLIAVALMLAGAASAGEVSKEDWMKAMQTALPTAFCAEGTYFRSCFKITAKECEDRAASATRVCLADVKDKLPAKFTSAEQGSEWGTKVGSCAGQAFEITFKAKMIDSAKCKDPNAWK